MMSGNLRIAVEGCGHGTLDSIYASVVESCRVKGWPKVDLLIICGDFQVCVLDVGHMKLSSGAKRLRKQAARNATDLNCMAVPVKYREIGDFHKYYCGERVAPFLTIFVGGNHEASNHLWELYYGGWVAPKIYYLGAANVVRLAGLRIAALSGIWKGYNYKKSHYERLPYNQDDVRSIYHVREIDTRKLLQIRTQVDIGISHDWPRGVEWMGDWRTLFRKKDQFEADSRAGNLGSVAAKLVMERLRPPHWFSAHLHIKYAAIVDHNAEPQSPTSLVDQKPPTTANRAIKGTGKVKNEEEIDLDMDEDEESFHEEERARESSVDPTRGSADVLGINSANDSDGVRAEENQISSSSISADLRAQLPASFIKVPQSAVQNESDPPTNPPTTIENRTTKFLALDKCLPKRDFLQLLEIKSLSAGFATEEMGGDIVHLCYDPEWLAITRAFAINEPPELGNPNAQVPRDKGRARYASLISTEEAWIDENVTKAGKLVIPENFELTAPTYDDSEPSSARSMPQEYKNPQTQAFCQMLGIENLFVTSEEEITSRMNRGPRPVEQRGGGFSGRGGRGRGESRDRAHVYRGRGRGRRGRARGWK